MTIQSLEGLQLERIAQSFNRAFSDYLVPILCDVPLLESRIQTENISLKYSAGAFSEGKLVGFILTGLDDFNTPSIAYNAGTGVIPAYRGQSLTEKIYSFLLPIFRQKGIHTCLLEVLQDNSPAIYIYKKIGFSILRAFNCYKGKINKRSPHPTSEFHFQDILEKDNKQLSSFWNFQPSWQNNSASTSRGINLFRQLGLYDGDNLLAYCIFNPNSNRIIQFGVRPDCRRNYYGTYLFEQLSSILGTSTIVINIESTDMATNNFLQAIGLKLYIQQFEMGMEI